MKTYQKPLGRSIAIGCIVFTAILSLALCVLNYSYQKSTLYRRYQSQITDILTYAEKHIDDEDLKRCIETGTESETYREMLLFMDEIMNSFSIHYLYAVKPLNTDETGNVMSVFSAEDDYNRYVDTEGNLYLGWIAEGEYDAETAQLLFDIMAQDDVVFFVEETGWSTDYTGALPLRDGAGDAYAVLAVDVDITALLGELRLTALKNVAVIVLLGLIYTVSFLLWTRRNITAPVRLLEESVVEFARRSHGQRSMEALAFNAPDIRTHNEIKSLSGAVAQMTEDMRQYVSDILTAEEHSRDMKQLADEMSELATVDPLTGLGNLTACMREEEAINRAIAEKDGSLRFALAMIDLNYLKYINDHFGHEKGDEALRRLGAIVRRVFAHSSVFRIGGDEFIVILRGADYDDAERLGERLRAEVAHPMRSEPWKNVSAAFGIARFDPAADRCMDDVLKRADTTMYDMKKAMRAQRQD